MRRGAGRLAPAIIHRSNRPDKVQMSSSNCIAIPDSTSFECESIEYFLVKITRHALATYRWRILRGGVARCSLRLGLSVCSGSVIRAVLCWLPPREVNSGRDAFATFVSPPSQIRSIADAREESTRVTARTYIFLFSRTNDRSASYKYNIYIFVRYRYIYIYIYIYMLCDTQSQSSQSSQSSVARIVMRVASIFIGWIAIKFAQVHESASRPAARCLMHVAATRGQDSSM